MAKPPTDPSENEVRAALEMEREPDVAFNLYCPTCRTTYPANSTAHAGH